ncbi:hypothetical protein H4Q32_007437 [Labeo rohita]|jgi:adenylate isopentenyltransferase (cytokinin synthase)
MQVH